MTSSQQQALLSLALHAAYADGNATPEEQAAVRQVAERYAGEGVRPPSNDPGERARAVQELAAQLRGPLTGLPAYEAALAVCEADKVLCDGEKAFLASLRAELGLDETYARDAERQADTWTTASAVPAVSAAAPPPPPPLAATVAAPELDPTILRNAILAGALELLPRSLATMAIVPLQMRLVYRIGQAYGYELDRGHIRDLLATVGVGLTSQVVEGFFQKVARGVLGTVAGGLGRALGGQVASSGLSFVTTYALGQLAVQYYAGGRTFSAIELRRLYDSLVGQGRALQERYQPQIQSQASQIQPSGISSLLKNL
ncbi:MAG: GTPase [Verrucomicrobiae bacterium]|nr:GTPase [Verrucomicrobiae bacterium]